MGKDLRHRAGMLESQQTTGGKDGEERQRRHPIRQQQTAHPQHVQAAPKDQILDTEGQDQHRYAAVMGHEEQSVVQHRKNLIFCL